MLSSVLRSKQAIQVNIAIMDAFVRLREMIASHKDLVRKIYELERNTIPNQSRFDAIRSLMTSSVKTRRIGF